MRKREGQGEEDMIQMALRMAEEMSGPIEDLESSVEPVAVSSGKIVNFLHLSCGSIMNYPVPFTYQLVENVFFSRSII